MGYAIELNLDPDSARKVMGLWEALARAGIDSTMLDVGAYPHISLAVFDELDPDILADELSTFARGEQPLAVRFSSVGTFPTQEGVVFLAPVVTAELLGLHSRFHQLLSSAGLEPLAYYRPGSWVPHCTAAIDLSPDKVPAAVELCWNEGFFGESLLVELGLIEFRPVREIFKHELGGLA